MAMTSEVIGGSSANLAPEEDVGLCPEGPVESSEKRGLTYEELHTCVYIYIYINLCVYRIMVLGGTMGIYGYELWVLTC